MTEAGPRGPDVETIEQAGQVMLLRVVTTHADIPRTGEGIASVHGEIQPVVAAMDGNIGFAMALDRSAGCYVGIAAWTDPAALDAGGRDALDLIAALARRLHGSEPSVEVFDLVLARVVKPVRIGHWARSARFEVPVSELARAARRYGQLVPAWFEPSDGVAAVLLFVNRSAGVLGSVIFYDTGRALRNGASRRQELGDLLVADLPTMTLVEDREWEVVIAELHGLSADVRVPYAWN